MRKKHLLKRTFILSCMAMLTLHLSACQQNEGLDYENNQLEVEEIKYQLTEEATQAKLYLNHAPESSYWFPEELLVWNANEDLDLEYNVSTIPLAERVDKDKLTPVNSTQNRDTKIMALSIMNSHTSGNLPHGGSSADCNIFTYWQYIDELIYWGGSSGEGLIVPPSPDVTNMGHKNGVPVIGTVFFPQQVAGGKMKWLDTFLIQEEDGSFPLADKLAEVAIVYGFDGWFINQETEGTPTEPLTKEHAKKMQQFIQYFKAKNPDLRIIYYDSMTSSGKIDWQNALTDKNAMFMVDENGNKVSDEMFLNFWWSTNWHQDQTLLEQSAKKALELGISPYELYAGIDLQASGNSTLIYWDCFMSGENSTHTSLGIYCPSWAYESSKNLEEFHEKENVIWVNGRQDPSVEMQYFSRTQWRGMSMFAVEKSAITSLPLITNFNTGSGYNFFKDGQKISERDWNNRSISDILPTYRWIIDDEEGNELEADFDTEKAWYGGTSVKLSGIVQEGKTSAIKLYSADLPVEKTTIFSTTAMANIETKLNLLLSFDDGSEEIIESKENVGEAWTTISFDISEFAGKNIRSIAYELKPIATNQEYQFNFGNITVADKEDKIAKISNLTVDDVEFHEAGGYAGVRLSWDSDLENCNYEIYRVNVDGSRSLLGVSNVTCFYINALRRLETKEQFYATESGTIKVDVSEFIVVPVNRVLEAGEGVSVTIEWPNNSLPKAGFTASQTLIGVGSTVVFTADCSENTETITWSLPGASTESAEGESVSVTYDKEGIYNVTITAKNAEGEATETKEGFIYVSSALKKDEKLQLLSANKDTDASAYVNEKEQPAFAVDGNYRTKWCATGTPPHTLVIDLGEETAVSEVAISHAEVGGESADWNTRAYTISVSTDGIEYVDAAIIKNNAEGKTLDTFAPINARYVKLSVVRATQGEDNAARIYEVEVYGLSEKLQ